METQLASGGLLEDLGINLKVLGTQVAIFTATFVVLSRLLFRRVLDQVTDREEAIRKSQEAIQHDRSEVDRLGREYEARIARADQEAYDRTQAIVKDAMASARASVAGAAAAARSEADKGIAEIEGWKRSVRPQVRARVREFTLAAVEKMLETELDAQTHGAIVDRFLSERS